MTYPEGVMRHVPARCAWAWAAWLAMLPVYPGAWAVTATGVTMSQKNAALEFLQALASGDPEAVALAIHPDDLRALRLRILTLLHNEAQRGDSTVRNRLFGPARPLGCGAHARRAARRGPQHRPGAARDHRAAQHFGEAPVGEQVRCLLRQADEPEFPPRDRQEGVGGAGGRVSEQPGYARDAVSDPAHRAGSR